MSKNYSLFFKIFKIKHWVMQNRILKTISFSVFTFFNISAQPNFVVEKLSSAINSSFEEITPVPSRDGRTLFFTRVGHPEFNRTLLIDSIEYAEKNTPAEYLITLGEVYSQISGTSIFQPERSSFNQDVWMSKSDSDFIFSESIHPGYPLNNALPNSLVAITPDPRSFYVINQYQRNGNMDRGFSRIRMENDSTWSFPEPIEITDYYTITSDVNLTMSFDGKILILSATRFDSKGMDLYVCFRTGKDQWSAPKNLGVVINSNRRETTPFLSEDNTTLFFSSNRWNSFGGNDIYESKRLDDSWVNWSEPEKLSEPINSSADDGQPYFNMTSGYLYFSSTRESTSDIYRVRIAPPQPTEMPVVGRVLNRKTNELISNVNIRYLPSDGSEADGGIIQSLDGTFAINIPRGIPFEFSASKEGLWGKSIPISFKRNYYYFREHYMDIYLDPLEKETTIELKPIFFAQSKASILEQSLPEVKRLAELLGQNPNIFIRIEGHTDNKGDAQELIELSELRAKAIKTQLIKEGIADHRIETIGVGSKYPANDNSTAELRQLNRRVVVTIIKI